MAFSEEPLLLGHSYFTISFSHSLLEGLDCELQTG
jgi:hypothetical protein